MIENFIQGNVYTYQRRILELEGEIARLKEENFALAANQCHHGYSGEYGHHCCKYQDEVQQLKEALLRARSHGVHSRMYHAFCAGDLADRIEKGMTGPLPDITSPSVKAEWAES
jgi:hypothetical protein